MRTLPLVAVTGLVPLASAIEREHVVGVARLGPHGPASAAECFGKPDGRRVFIRQARQHQPGRAARQIAGERVEQACTRIRRQDRSEAESVPVGQRLQPPGLAAQGQHGEGIAFAGLSPQWSASPCHQASRSNGAGAAGADSRAASAGSPWTFLRSS